LGRALPRDRPGCRQSCADPRELLALSGIKHPTVTEASTDHGEQRNEMDTGLFFCSDLIISRSASKSLDLLHKMHESWSA
jgi:hypothetical protein